MTGLIAAGRRREAVVRFLPSIGLPVEVVDQMLASTPVPPAGSLPSRR